VPSVRPPSLILLLLLALVFRGGLHLHLCFDGSEPPVSVHAADHVTHHAEVSDLSHEDADVFLGGSAPPRMDDPGVQAPALLAAFLVVVLLLLPGSAPRPSGRWFLPSPAPLRSRPPCRGPPHR